MLERQFEGTLYWVQRKPRLNRRIVYDTHLDRPSLGKWDGSRCISFEVRELEACGSMSNGWQNNLAIPSTSFPSSLKQNLSRFPSRRFPHRGFSAIPASIGSACHGVTSWPATDAAFKYRVTGRLRVCGGSRERYACLFSDREDRG